MISKRLPSPASAAAASGRDTDLVRPMDPYRGPIANTLPQFSPAIMVGSDASKPRGQATPGVGAATGGLSDPGCADLGRFCPSGVHHRNLCERIGARTDGRTTQ
jgi:hypothetical protein